MQLDRQAVYALLNLKARLVSLLWSLHVILAGPCCHFSFKDLDLCAAIAYGSYLDFEDCVGPHPLILSPVHSFLSAQ